MGKFPAFLLKILTREFVVFTVKKVLLGIGFKLSHWNGKYWSAWINSPAIANFLPKYPTAVPKVWKNASTIDSVLLKETLLSLLMDWIIPTPVETAKNSGFANPSAVKIGVVKGLFKPPSNPE